MKTILIGAVLTLRASAAQAADAPPEITLPDVLAIKLAKGLSQVCQRLDVTAAVHR